MIHCEKQEEVSLPQFSPETVKQFHKKGNLPQSTYDIAGKEVAKNTPDKLKTMGSVKTLEKGLGRILNRPGYIDAYKSQGRDVTDLVKLGKGIRKGYGLEK